MGRSGLSENDPYREMNTGEDEIRPDFLSGVRDWEAGEAYRLNGESYDKDGKKIKKRKSAGKVLGASEKAAAGESGGFSNNLSGMRERESSAPGIINSVKGKSGKDGGGKGKFGGKGKLKGKGFLKKGGPIVIIGGIFAVVAGVMAGAQNLMPIAIEEMIIEKFNSIGISSTMASDEWLDTQLNQGVRQGNPKSDEPDTMYAFSEYQVQQFKKQGITVVNGDGITALLYEKNGQYIPVVGSAALDSMSESEIISKIQSASGLSNIGKPISAKEALADADFKNPYTTASKSWRGGASGWFDNIMGDVTEVKLGTGRNRWVRWATKKLKNTNKKLEEFKNTASGKDKVKDDGVSDYASKENDDGERENVEEDIKKVETVEGEDTPKIVEDADGNKSTVGIGDESVGDSSLNEGASKGEIQETLTSKALKAAGTAADVASYGCAVIEGLMSIYTLVSAYQNLQFLNLISGFLEAVDKVKAGDDNGSPIHTYGENLTTKANTLDDDGKVAKGHENKTAMEAAGMAWLFGKAVVVMQSDPSVRNINFETIMSNITTVVKDVKRLKEFYEGCGYVKMASAVINLTSTVISIVTGGISGLFKLSLKEIGKAVILATVKHVFSLIIPIAAKNIAKLMIKNAATEWFGEDLGNAVISGASKYLGGNGTSGLQSPASKAKLLSYMDAKNVVIAEEAEYQRAVRSPFDATSHYTFLGNLAYSIIPLAYSNGLLANLTSVSSLVSSSAIAMLPTASAIDENSVLNSKGDCDLLESTGAVGDAFCNAYIITDVSSMGTSPVAVNEIVHKLGGDTEIASVESTVAGLGDNFDSDGSIKKDSELAKFVTYCGQRTAQYGLKDANIAVQTTGGGGVSDIMGSAPGIGDVAQMFEGLNEMENMKWTNGSACIATDEKAANGPSWNDEYRWYQRYSENQRLLENMNPGYTSEITAYLNDYYEENPLDQSFEGTLARFSGMTKEKVEDTLALMDYYEFLEDYNPSERYAFGKPVVEEGKELRFDNENSVAENIWIVLLNQISYADVRNRSFAV